MYAYNFLHNYNSLKICFFLFRWFKNCAKKKANKARTTNELSSHNEGIRKERTRKKQRVNKNRNKRFSDTSLDNTSFDDSSNDGNTYPIPSFPISKKSVNGKYILLFMNKACNCTVKAHNIYMVYLI